MTARPLEVTFRWGLGVNDFRPNTWRRRVAKALRRLASVFDGRQTLVLEVVTDPPLTPAEHRTVWDSVHQYWLGQLRQAAQHAAWAAAEEREFQSLHPSLFPSPEEDPQ